MGDYAVGDVLCGRRYPGYSFTDQAISELSAFGSPVRPSMVTFITAHGLLIGSFAVGVRRAAGTDRALQVTAGSLMASVVTTLLGGRHGGLPGAGRARVALRRGLPDSSRSWRCDH